MNIIEFVLILIISILNTYIMSSILEIKINYSKFNIYIGIVLISIMYILIYSIDFLNPYRFIINILTLFLVFLFIFRQNYIKTIISIFILFLISSILEIISVISLILFNCSINSLNLIHILVLNVVYLIISLRIINLKRFKLIKQNIFDIKDEIKIFVFFTGIFIIIVKKFPNIYEKLNDKMNFICMCVFILGVIILIISNMIEKSKKQIIFNEYNNLLEYVKNYEKIIEEKSKKQHEYKNQLVVIMAMIEDKKIKTYIDNLLKDNIDNSDILSELNKISIKGLKGLLYYKIKIAIDNNIDIKLDIGDLENRNIYKLEENDIMDLTKLIGVFIDNAIEAVLDLSKKHISISIYINDDNKLVISIANNFRTTLNIDKVLKKGYTTKGKNHGYGLMLVKDVVKNNDRLSNTTELISNVFIQNIFYDLKDL